MAAQHQHNITLQDMTPITHQTPPWEILSPFTGVCHIQVTST